jgi:tol-pal system protein YbgF
MKEMKRVGAPSLLAALALVCGAPLFAATVDTVEQRLTRMERVLESQSLLQMMERIDALQQEVQQLRGQLEEQQHQMAGVRERQRELYLDLDRRMSRLEREGSGVPASAPAGTSPGAATVPLTQAPLSAATASTSVPSPVNATVSAAAADPQRLEQEREAYQQAFELLRELRYEQASAAFRDFLKQYPDGRYAHIAQYWLGEAAYARRDFVQAIKDYDALLQNHPQSAKRAEAMLKIGYSYQELKRGEESKRMMEQLIQLYPDSTEAGQARNQLKRLKQSGG